MRPFASTILFAEAQRRLAGAARPIDRVERVTLDEASGRVVAADVRSPLDVPPFARATMDGYAVVAGDTAGATRDNPARLRMIDRIYTGQVSQAHVVPG